MLLSISLKFNMSLNPCLDVFQLTASVSLHSYFSLVYSRVIYSFDRYVTYGGRTRIQGLLSQYIYFLLTSTENIRHDLLLFTHSID